jgi:hypothetical protein
MIEKTTIAFCEGSHWDSFENRKQFFDALVPKRGLITKANVIAEKVFVFFVGL